MFRRDPKNCSRGMIVSEGAGAVLLGRTGHVEIEKIAGGTNFRRQSEAGAGVEKVFAELCEIPPDFVAASANGTFIDAAESAAISVHCPKAKVYAIKGALGEGVGASSLWQTIGAVQALRTQGLRSAIVSTCGLNQQVAGLRLALPPAA